LPSMHSLDSMQTASSMMSGWSSCTQLLMHSYIFIRFPARAWGGKHEENQLAQQSVPVWYLFQQIKSSHTHLNGDSHIIWWGINEVHVYRPSPNQINSPSYYRLFVAGIICLLLHVQRNKFDVNSSLLHAWHGDAVTM
jgi:hypothetical protein